MAVLKAPVTPNTTQGAKPTRGWRRLVLVLALCPIPALSGTDTPTGGEPPTVGAADRPRGDAWTESRGQTPPPTQEPDTPWLDEVRAQRQAWEERRRANREAFELRRRLADPWGSAQHEAWEDEVERRREARRQQREQERGLFRGLGPAEPPPPWSMDQMNPQGTYSGPASSGGPSGDPPPARPEPPGPGVVYPPGSPPRGPYSPQDWDNLWYYRGY